MQYLHYFHTCMYFFSPYLSSRQLAEEVMKGGPPDDEEEAEEGGAPASVQGFEGMEALAKAIELGKSRPHAYTCVYMYICNFEIVLHIVRPLHAYTMYMYIYNVNVRYAVLARVQVTLSDTVIQVNYRTADQTQDYFLKLRVQR